jgi:hypothetical protein
MPRLLSVPCLVPLAWLMAWPSWILAVPMLVALAVQRRGCP